MRSENNENSVVFIAKIKIEPRAECAVQRFKAMDLHQYVRRPFEVLRGEGVFGKRKNTTLILDESATEAVRWVGGLNFLLGEIEAKEVLDLSQVDTKRIIESIELENGRLDNLLSCVRALPKGVRALRKGASPACRPYVIVSIC